MIPNALKEIPGARIAARFLRFWPRYLRYLRQYREFSRLPAADRFPMLWTDRSPQLHDCTGVSHFDRHYVYHTAWAARVLAQTRPILHVDVSSSLYFCSIVSAFVPVRFLDYRPAILTLSGLSSDRGDLMSLPLETGSVQSLSCMHVIEHIGLGRYGDALDPNGDLRAISELRRVLASEGTLLVVVPVGTPRIQFNAHRIYGYDQFRDYFADLELADFSLVPDDPKEGLICGASGHLADAQRYGCGCFWFRKADSGTRKASP